MRHIEWWVPALLVLSLPVGVLGPPYRLAADDAPNLETPPTSVQQVLDQYLKAVAANDVKAMAELANVPWLDRDRHVTRDRDELEKVVERDATQLPRNGEQKKVSIFPRKKMRDYIKDEASRSLLDEVLGDGDWVALVEYKGDPMSARAFLIRVNDGKAVVAGGPLKQNQISHRNRIPETVERLLDKGKSFELYSLDPSREPSDPANLATNDFRGWKVLGKTEVKDAAERKRLTDSLRLGAEDNFGLAAACFLPRHGLRLKEEKKTIDLVICFQCLQALVYEDDELNPGFLTSGDPQEVFDAILKAAGVPLPKQADD